MKGDARQVGAELGGAGDDLARFRRTGAELAGQRLDLRLDGTLAELAPTPAEAVLTDAAPVGTTTVRATTAAEGDAPLTGLAFVSGGFFAATGGRVTLGRPLEPADEEHVYDGGSPPVVVSFVFWTSRLNRDPAVVGRTIRLTAGAFTVVGVAPQGFQGSVRGIRVCQEISNEFELHAFNNRTNVRSVIRRDYRADLVRSNRLRTPEERQILAEKGRQVAVLEAQGALFFGSTEQLMRRVTQFAAEARYVIVDFKRVHLSDSSARKLILRAAGADLEGLRRLARAPASPYTLVDRPVRVRKGGFEVI